MFPLNDEKVRIGQTLEKIGKLQYKVIIKTNTTTWINLKSHIVMLNVFGTVYAIKKNTD